MTRIFKIIGPPGTGKTTEVARQCMVAAARYGPEYVVVTSLTKAAAREAAGRETSLPSENISTLHAACYRALDRPKIVDRPLIREWNKRWGNIWALPLDTVGGSGLDDDESGGGGDDIGRAGEDFYAQADLLRAQMIPESDWSRELLSFYHRWCEFKAESNAVDFTDLIERGIHELPLPPHNAQSMFVDEAQDLSRLEQTLIEHWAQHCESVVFVGDADQALYSWRGASPDIMAEPIFKVLDQSYRVPRRVQGRALRVIASSSTYHPYEYKPRDAEGEVEQMPHDYRDGAAIVNRIERSIYAGRRVMFLASCAYMLNPVLAELRERGIAYANPYSPGRWSPLEPTTGHSTARRLLALLACARQFHGDAAADFWSAKDVRLWLPLLKGSSGTGDEALMRRGCKSAVENLPLVDGWLEAADFCSRYIDYDAKQKLLQGDLAFIERHIAVAYQDRTDYVLKVMHKLGVAGLERWLSEPKDERRPQVIVGTIHSVKGGVADDVIVAPDLSAKGWNTYNIPGWGGYDAVLRTFYVAFTRAANSLTTLEPLGDYYCKEAL